MRLEVGLVAESVMAEARCLDDILQHPSHVAVHIFDVELALLDGLDDILDLSRIARHEQVVARMNLLGNGQVGALADPVGHDDAIEPPVVAEHLGEQIVVALGVDTIDFVVGRHDRPRLRLAYCHLKATKIELAQGPLRDALVDTRAVTLLRIDSKMLHRYPYALALYATNHGCTDHAGYYRVFTIVLKVSATERTAM